VPPVSSGGESWIDLDTHYLPSRKSSINNYGNSLLNFKDIKSIKYYAPEYEKEIMV
jgi:hypothetical protein